MTVLDTLEERGFVEAKTHEQELTDFVNQGRVTCYCGFDPTASSLHIGSLIPIMALAHMQRAGHRPIALVGGGTGLVGDPSGKTEMRQILTIDTVEENVQCLKKQLSRFLEFGADKAMLLNNADWLTKLNYIEFLRDIGRYFSVNRMIKAESCKLRLDSEEGLSFIEFNYTLLQAYDFLVLSKGHDCMLQLGGSDQWGNIVAGIDLIRRVTQKPAFGLTFPLITTASGAKMGKTAAGAVWLDADRTSPYDYFQYWVNTDDADVRRFLALYTFLPMSEISATEKLVDAELNAAKTVLAYETTRLVHGKAEAEKAYFAARKMFGGKAVPKHVLPESDIPRTIEEAGEDNMPHSTMATHAIELGVPAFKLFYDVGLTDSSGAARRLISQGGAYINGQRIESFDQIVSASDINDLAIVLRAGKKKYHKILIKD